MITENKIYKKPSNLTITSLILLIISIFLVIVIKSLANKGGWESLYLLFVLPLLFLCALVILILSIITLLLINKKRDLISDSSRKSLSLFNILYLVVILIELIIIYI